jgi:hypothetical protein
LLKYAGDAEPKFVKNQKRITGRRSMKKEEIVVLRVRPPMAEKETGEIAVSIKNRLSPLPVAVPAQHQLAAGDASDASVFIEGNINSKSAKQLGGEIMGYMLQASSGGNPKIVMIKNRKETLRLIGFECPESIGIDQKNHIRQAIKHLDARAEVYFNPRKGTKNGKPYEATICEVKTDVKLADLKEKLKQTLGGLFDGIIF